MFFFLWNGLALEKYYSRSCIRSAWLGLAMGDKRQGHCGILEKNVSTEIGIFNSTFCERGYKGNLGYSII